MISSVIKRIKTTGTIAVYKALLRHNIISLIHIDSLKTPNPNFLKFIPCGKDILGAKGTLDISSVQYADISPLAI